MKMCSVVDCQSEVKHKGLCGKHYKRQWRHGDPNISLINMDKNRPTCRVEGCERIIISAALGLCDMHQKRLARYGRLNNIIAGRGTGNTNASGYRQISVNRVKVYEHIHLAEIALGRKLPEGAVVHHINEDPGDNSTPFNLVICPDQAYHMLLHKRTNDLARIIPEDEL